MCDFQLFFSFFFVFGAHCVNIPMRDDFLGGFFLMCMWEEVFFIIHKQIFDDFSIFLYIFFSYRHFFFLNLYLKKVNQWKKSSFFLLFLFSSNFDLLIFLLGFSFFFLHRFFSSRIYCCCFTKHSYFKLFFLFLKWRVVWKGALPIILRLVVIIFFR